MPAAVRQVAPALPAGCVQAPAPLHTSRVQGFASSAHGELEGSKVHVGEQQSPATVFPSSHCSAPVIWPSPQTLPGVVVVVVLLGLVVVVLCLVVVVIASVDVVGLVLVVVVAGQSRQHGSVGARWTSAGGTIDDPVREGTGGDRCWRRFCAVALSIPRMVIVELAWTVLVPLTASPTAGPCAESRPDEVMLTPHPARRIEPPTSPPSLRS